MRRTLLLILLLLAGCNLETSGVATLEPTATAYVAPTPYRGPTAIVAPTLITQGQGIGVQNAGGTPTSGSAPTSVPPQTIQIPQVAPGSQNVIEAFFENLVIPALNFLYTFATEGIGTLWLFAGARGGVLAQVTCCIAPMLLIGGLLLRRLRIGRWRR